MKNNILTTVLLLLISAAMSAQTYVPGTNNQLVYPVETYELNQAIDTTNYEITPIGTYNPTDTTNHELLMIEYPQTKAIDTTLRKRRTQPSTTKVPRWYWESSSDTIQNIIQSPFNQCP